MGTLGSPPTACDDNEGYYNGGYYNGVGWVSVAVNLGFGYR